MAEDIIIPIDITGGMDDHSSLKQTQDPELIENITLDDNGYPKKRNGFYTRPANIDLTNNTNNDFIPLAKTIISERNRDTIYFEKYVGTYSFYHGQTKLEVQDQSQRLGVTAGLSVEYEEIDTSQRRQNTPDPTSDNPTDNQDTFSQMEWNAKVVGDNIHAIFYDKDLDSQIIDRDSGVYVLPEDANNTPRANFPRMVQTPSDIYYCFIDINTNPEETNLRLFSLDGSKYWDQGVNTNYVFVDPEDGTNLTFGGTAPRISVVVDPVDPTIIHITYMIVSTIGTNGHACAQIRIASIKENPSLPNGFEYNNFRSTPVFRLTEIINTTSGVPLITTDGNHFYIYVAGRNNGPFFRFGLDLDVNGVDYWGSYFISNGTVGGLPSVLCRDASIAVYNDHLVVLESFWGSYSASTRGVIIPFTVFDNFTGSLNYQDFLQGQPYYSIFNFLGPQWAPYPTIPSFAWKGETQVTDFAVWRNRLVTVMCHVRDEQYNTYLVELDIKRGLQLVSYLNYGDKLGSYTENWGESGQLSNLTVDGENLYIPITFTSDIYNAEYSLNNWVATRQHVRAVLIKVTANFISKTTFNELVLSSSNQPLIQAYGKSVPTSFAHPPTIANVIGSGSTGFNYFYIAVYEFFDDKGNVYRSQLSNSYNILTSPTSTNKVYVTTYIFADPRIHTVALYRTKNNQPDTFYFVGRYTNQSLFRPAIDGNSNAVQFSENEIRIDDTASDAALGGELYTAQLSSNSELENTAPQPMNFIINHNNRIYGVSSQDTRKIVYSKQATEGRGLEFNDTLSIIVERDKEGQDAGLVALASTENYLLCFKRSSIFAISGDGPNNVGIGETHTLPILVSDTIGCVDPASVISVTMGAVFKSHKGFTVITKGLQIVDINAGTEAREDAKILRSLIHRKRNVAMFLTEDGEILCLDMNDNENPIKWTIFTGFLGCVDMTYSNDQLRILKQTGDVLLENDVFRDDNTFITQKMTTGWLRVGDIAEYQRVKRLFVTGEYKSDHTLKVDVSYDFEDYVDKTYTLTPITGYETGTKPADGTINAGGNTGVYEWDIHLARQKCSAIKFTIYDEERNGIIGESFQLEGLALKIGKKAGLRKINEQKRG